MKHPAGNADRGLGVRTILVFAAERAVPVKLRTALEADREFKLLCICSSRVEIVRRAAESQPHVTLFWFRTDADLAVIEELRRLAPASAMVLCVPGDLSPETVRQARALGVRALLSTTAGWETFKDCLRLSAGDKIMMAASCSSRAR
jgi:DNA-binding NarL/FixJ family response regulator